MTDIVGYNGRYKVNEEGKVWSVASNRYIGSNVKDAYPIVDLRKDGKQNIVAIHRIVAEHFIPNPENKPEVNHIDGNKHNNNISNLEWVTTSENRLHAWGTKLQTNEGLVKARRKLSPEQVVEIRARYKARCKVNGTRALSREFNVSQTQISFIVNNKERINNEHI